MTDQVIYDRGYRPYQGPRTGSDGARWAVYKEGILRVFGLGRKARRKVFPWTLMAIALVAAGVFVGIHWLIGDLTESLRQGVPSYGELFDFYSWISILFIALAGPQLLIPDRVQGVLSVYFSRPLPVEAYLASKAGAFATVVASIYLVPQLMLHLGLAFIAREGFFSYLGANLDVLWKVPATIMAFVALHGAVALALSSLIGRTGMAAAAYLGLLLAGRAVADTVATVEFTGSRWMTLLALDHHPRIIRDSLFNPTVTYPAEAVGFQTWMSALVIAVAVGIAAWVMLRRYQRLA